MNSAERNSRAGNKSFNPFKNAKNYFRLLIVRTNIEV